MAKVQLITAQWATYLHEWYTTWFNKDILSTTESKVFLLLGSNLGNSVAIIEQAKMLLSEMFGQAPAESAIYSSPPWGFNASGDFLNQLLIFNTEFGVNEVLAGCLKIEEKLGRVRMTTSEKYTSRIIDIDLLYYNREVLNTATLTVPHPRLHLRQFALIPLVEMEPQMTHPVLLKTHLQLLKDCPDKSTVNKLDERD